MDGAEVHQTASGKHRRIARKRPPHVEGEWGAPLRGGEKPVGDHQPRDPVTVLGSDAQTDQ
ncbi:Uncharacterised protein [Mycobacterium tuberculosis]|uniref:Uncharacterized protein n=1 Tax=Mycobacterium tuberculosis TaxID=1773 RepID=A0A655I277_MYCTX|nr:Uncharacterised protein [Mycobacterium tuberculosis]COV37077.1 Uncharacterised protein [Mycobacterium tuberculosis]